MVPKLEAAMATTSGIGRVAIRKVVVGRAARSSRVLRWFSVAFAITTVWSALKGWMP